MKINNLYGFSHIRPEYTGKIVMVRPPLWKRLWYSFTGGLYQFFLIFMMAAAFTCVIYAPLVGELLYLLIIG